MGVKTFSKYCTYDSMIPKLNFIPQNRGGSKLKQDIVYSTVFPQNLTSKWWNADLSFSCISASFQEKGFLLLVLRTIENVQWKELHTDIGEIFFNISLKLCHLSLIVLSLLNEWMYRDLLRCMSRQIAAVQSSAVMVSEWWNTSCDPAKYTLTALNTSPNKVMKHPERNTLMHAQIQKENTLFYRH